VLSIAQRVAEHDAFLATIHPATCTRSEARKRCTTALSTETSRCSASAPANRPWPPLPLPPCMPCLGAGACCARCRSPYETWHGLLGSDMPRRGGRGGGRGAGTLSPAGRGSTRQSLFRACDPARRARRVLSGRRSGRTAGDGREFIRRQATGDRRQTTGRRNGGAAPGRNFV